MIPIPQRISASGGGIDPNTGEVRLPGDCFKCCVASILELPYEDVPHFVAGEVMNPNLCTDGTPHPDGPYPMGCYDGLEYWMKRRGYTVVPVYDNYFKDVDLQIAWRRELEAAKMYTPRNLVWLLDPRDRPPWQYRGYWIASVISENFVGATHAIVMKGSDVVFDPSPHHRQTPYRYVGECVFVAPDPSRCLRS